MVSAHQVNQAIPDLRLTTFENMEGDERRQGSSSHDPTLERRAPDSGGLTSTDQLHEESTSNASLNSATCGVGTTEASSTLAGPSLAAEAGEVLVSSTRQRTAPSDQENLVPTASIFSCACILEFQSLTN